MVETQDDDDDIAANMRQLSGGEDDPNSPMASSLLTLSDDVLFSVLLYAGPKGVENAKLVCRRLHTATSHSSALWREFCVITGKCIDSKAVVNIPKSAAIRSKVLPSRGNVVEKENNAYRAYYFSNPCVPIDFGSIAEALKHCPRTPLSVAAVLLADDEFIYTEQGTVCLMPGVYREQIVIKGEVWGVGNNSSSISLRPSFPLVPNKGVTIMHYNESQDVKNQPCIAVSTRDEETLLQGVQKGISLTMSYLNIVHKCSGSDIWNGNSAIKVDGARAQVHTHSCVVRSHSGRGVVVTNQAELQMTMSSVIDCAATGIYLGDWGSRGNIVSCNIVSNGFGSKQLRSCEDGRRELDIVLNEWTRLRRDSDAGSVPGAERFHVVPAGHSGVYVEGAMCWIEDSCIALNCLTGASVVRNGFLSLSGCDIASSSSHPSQPILIEDDHDVNNPRNNGDQGARIRGGVIEGPQKNNYTGSCEKKLRAPMTEKEFRNLLDVAVDVAP